MARPGGWGLYERSHQQSLMAMLRLSAWGRGVMDKAGWSEEAGGQGQGWGGGGVSLMNVCSGGSSPSWSAAGSQQWRRWQPEGRPGQGVGGGGQQGLQLHRLLAHANIHLHPEDLWMHGGCQPMGFIFS